MFTRVGALFQADYFQGWAPLLYKEADNFKRWPPFYIGSRKFQEVGHPFTLDKASIVVIHKMNKADPMLLSPAIVVVPFVDIPFVYRCFIR